MEQNELPEIPKRVWNDIVFCKRNCSFQFVAGILAGFLNLALSTLMLKIGVPLFMDTLFTVTASCFGLFGGLVAAVFSHIISFVVLGFDVPTDIPNMIFVFCSLTVVAGTRILIHFAEKKRFSVAPAHLLMTGIALALVISVEGGSFYVLLLRRAEYVIDNKAVSTLIYTLITKHIPLIASSTLARIPVNMVDKLIAVFAGWYLAVICDKKSAIGRNA